MTVRSNCVWAVAVKIDNVYEVEMPREVNQMLQNLSFMVSFGFDGLDSLLACMDMPGYGNKLVVFLVAPVAVALTVLLIGVVYVVCAGRPIRMVPALLGAYVALAPSEGARPPF